MWFIGRLNLCYRRTWDKLFVRSIKTTINSLPKSRLLLWFVNGDPEILCKKKSGNFANSRNCNAIPFFEKRNRIGLFKMLLRYLHKAILIVICAIMLSTCSARMRCKNNSNFIYKYRALWIDENKKTKEIFEKTAHFKIIISRPSVFACMEMDYLLRGKIDCSVLKMWTKRTEEFQW